MTAPVLIHVDHVSKRFSRKIGSSLSRTFEDIFGQWKREKSDRSLRVDEFWALSDVSFDVRQGEAVALIGDNGAGKSTLVKLLMGRMQPTEGTIATQGSISALTVLGLGFDPVLSGRENIFINAATLGMSRRQTTEVLEQIIEFAELREFIDVPVQSYSSGMRARLGYAVAAHVNPDILLLDEVLAVGDIRFRRKCRRHIKNYIDSGGTTILVTHDMHAVQTMCTRCIVIERGRVTYDGPPLEGINTYIASRVEEEDREETGPAVTGQVAREVLPPLSFPQEGNGRSVAQEAKPQEPVTAPVGGSEKTGEARASAPTTSAGVQRSHLAISAEEAARAPLVEARREASPVFEANRAGRPLTRTNSVVLEQLHIRSLDGGPVRTGQAVELGMKYKSLESHDGIMWGFSILSVDGLTHIASAIHGLSGPSYSLQQGEHWLKCRVERFPLMAGRYGLRAGVGEVDSGASLCEIGWEDSPVFFTVQTDATPENNFRSIMGDTIALDSVPM